MSSSISKSVYIRHDIVEPLKLPHFQSDVSFDRQAYENL